MPCVPYMGRLLKADLIHYILTQTDAESFYRSQKGVKIYCCTQMMKLTIFSFATECHVSEFAWFLETRFQAETGKALLELYTLFYQYYAMTIKINAL